MLPFLKKKAVTQTSAVDHTASQAARDLSEFIPYYCHYNAQTLLTKNGELMQTIRIRCNNEGVNYESGESEQETVREYIRAALSEAITSDDYALWIHTVRRRKKVHYSSKVTNPFAAYVNNEWQKAHHWKFQYYNEIYVSVLSGGQSGDLIDKKNLARAVFPKSNRALRNEFLDRTAERLTAATDRMLARIRMQYRAERLSIVDRQGVYYSEPVEFLGKIVNLRTEPSPVRECDLSRQLFSHALTFGFNAMEARNPVGQHRFGAILSLKQYREVPPVAVDQLLQAPIECIVTQVLVFSSAKKLLKDYKQQRDIFKVSGDTLSMQSSGLADILDGELGRPTDFGTLQTAVTIITDEYKQLDTDVGRAQTAFGEMGLLTVREDIKLEECFWSLLPGNFTFIRRKDMVPSGQFAGFARLNLFPDGKDSGNHWGTALAMVPTQVNSPYFFNFHQRDNGHSVLLDFNPFGDHTAGVLTNFLITSAMKYNGRILIFDRKKSAQLLFDKLNGDYHTTFGLNPFSLPDDKRNRGFLLAWCGVLAGADDAARTALEAAIDRVYAEAPERRQFSTFLTALAAIDATLAHHFEPYAKLFSESRDSIDVSKNLVAINMDDVMKKRGNHTMAAFAYLMHRVILSLDGKPTIIVLHDAFELIENPFFASRLESLMDMLTQNNAMLLCTTQKPEQARHYSAFAPLLAKSATLLILPDDVTESYSEVLPQLTMHDDDMLRHMHRDHGEFLIRQGKESIALRINLDDMEACQAIFANDVKTLIAAGGPFATLPKYGYDKKTA